MSSLALTDRERLLALEEAERTFPMNEDEFRAFYELTARPVWVYINRMTGDGRLADDLLQEAYYRLLRTSTPRRDSVRSARSLDFGDIAPSSRGAASTRMTRAWRTSRLGKSLASTRVNSSIIAATVISRPRGGLLQTGQPAPVRFAGGVPVFGT